MNKIIWFISLLSFILLSCGSGKKENNADNLENTKDDSVSTVKDEIAGMGEIEYDCEADEIYKGKKVASACWSDRRGKNLVVISQLEQYFWKEENPSMKKNVKDEEDELAAELFAYHFVYDEPSKKWNTYWMLNDFNIGCCDVWIEYQEKSLQVTDVDGDGDGDPSFLYLIYSGTNAMDFYYNAKLITYADSLKLKASGTMGMGKEMIEEGGLKKEIYEKTFKNVDASFEEYAKNRWKECVENQMKYDEISSGEMNEIDDAE